MITASYQEIAAAYFAGDKAIKFAYLFGSCAKVAVEKKIRESYFPALAELHRDFSEKVGQ